MRDIFHRSASNHSYAKGFWNNVLFCVILNIVSLMEKEGRSGVCMFSQNHHEPGFLPKTYS